ncbi:MAG TPA: insulinase family protein, partial [Candidatus Mailhella excrementigallinarum]|nr:insulinase family protein [Candidatus Mailhella excrementigallinarum]
MKPGVRALRAGAALLLAALLLVPYPSGAAARISGENAPVAARADGPHIFHLKNGLTIAVKEDSRFPLASVRLYVNAGSAWEQPGEAGISHLLEHMVFKGSKTGPKGVDKRVENAGGYLNASTSFDETIYLTDLPAAQWKTALRAVRDLAFDPLLRQADLDAEREVVLAEKKQRGDSPWTRLFHESFGLALKGTPYERPVIGYEDTLRAATPASMRAYI